MHVRFVEPQQMPEVPRPETASSHVMKTLTFVDKSQEKRNFVCPVCKRTFKRSEHCARHQRAHTQERPFPCKFCDRRYARRDLVARHERAVHAHGSSDVAPSVPVPGVSGTSVSTKGDDRLKSGSNAAAEDRVESSRQEETATMALFFEQAPVASLPMESSPQDTNTNQEHENEDSAVHRRSFLESFHPENGVHAFKRAGRSSLEGDFDMLMNDIQTTDQPSSLDIFDELNFFDPYNGMSPLPNITLSPSVQTNLRETNHTTTLRSFNATRPATFQLWGQEQRQHRSIQVSNTSATNAVFPLLSPTTDPSSIPTSSGPSDTYTCSPKSSDSVSGTSRKLRLAPLTESHRDTILQECHNTPVVAQRDDAKHITLPSTNTLNQLLGTFVDVFLSHLPVIHLPTFDLDKTQPPLILSMCAIGALYRLERKMSLDLYLQADQLLLREWHKPARREEAFESEYHNRKRKLSPEEPSTLSNWSEWCNRESEKSLITAAYDIPPVLSVLQDGEVELPSEDKLWVAPSEVMWQQCVNQTERVKAVSIIDGVSCFMDTTPQIQQTDSDSGLHPSWPPFAVVIILHGVSTQFWHMSQYADLTRSQRAQNLSLCFSTTTTTAAAASSTPTTASPSLEFLLHEHNETILDRCRSQTPRQTKVPANDGLWDETEGPLSFNCLCILRLIHLRAFTGANPIDKGILLTSDPSEVTTALQKFMSSPQTRNVYVTKTARQALEGIKTPSQVGWKLVQKTVGFKWSVDVAIFYWAFGLFFVRWIHTIEKLIKGHHSHHHRQHHDMPGVDEAETSVLEETRRTFLENDLMTTTMTTTDVDNNNNNDPSDSFDDTGDKNNHDRSSLAAQVSRHLAVYFTDTWSWGITARFGHVLNQLAEICERDL
ncbi:hypothetical protein H2204_000733 [Knufia peltigerae]|uniref:C2H2-type domain-containing protein n=1 Tax=Knufia peltigerae TaxID=1002370 RepID=A0AA38YE11_9EURO|nr:hypothetical protein H2204_000733 [Knufia peltigerae]